MQIETKKDSFSVYPLFVVLFEFNERYVTRCKRLTALIFLSQQELLVTPKKCKKMIRFSN